jgi:heme/copper-type cytochrome/quinol oxidase subunit 2
MLKRGTVILVQFFQQVLMILVLMVFVMGVVIGLMLYSVPTALQSDGALPPDSIPSSPLTSLPLLQGHPE